MQEGILQGGLTPKAFLLPKQNDGTLHYPALKPHGAGCDPNNVQWIPRYAYSGIFQQ